MIGAVALGHNVRGAERERAGDEDVIELPAYEVRAFTVEWVCKAERGNALFKFNALALVAHNVAHASAEKPIERRDERRVEDVEVSANYRGERGIILTHRGLEFFASRFRVRENQMEAEYAHGPHVSFDFDVSKKSVTIPYTRPMNRSHRFHKEPRSQRLMRHFQREFAVGNYFVAAHNDEIVPLDSPRIDAVYVGHESDVHGKLPELVQKFLRYFLQAQHVEIKVPDEFKRALELAVAEKYVPRVDFHPVVKLSYANDPHLLNDKAFYLHSREEDVHFRNGELQSLNKLIA